VRMLICVQICHFEFEVWKGTCALLFTLYGKMALAKANSVIQTKHVGCQAIQMQRCEQMPCALAARVMRSILDESSLKEPLTPVLPVQLKHFRPTRLQMVTCNCKIAKNSKHSNKNDTDPC